MLCAPGEEVRAGPASDDLIRALQSILIEDEEASDVIMLAISRLSYEQLQVVQVQPLCSSSHRAPDMMHLSRRLYRLMNILQSA